MRRSEDAHRTWFPAWYTISYADALIARNEGTLGQRWRAAPPVTAEEVRTPDRRAWVLEPVLRSRGGIEQAAIYLSEDRQFARDIEALLRGDPAGRYQPPALSDLTDRVEDLEARLKKLESLLPVPHA